MTIIRAGLEVTAPQAFCSAPQPGNRIADCQGEKNRDDDRGQQRYRTGTEYPRDSLANLVVDSGRGMRQTHHSERVVTREDGNGDEEKILSKRVRQSLPRRRCTRERCRDLRTVRVVGSQDH